MAVYERSYRPPSGDATSLPVRLLVLPRYAYQRIFKSRWFLVFFVLSLLYPLACAVLMYIPHSSKFLELFEVDASVFQPWIEQFVYPATFMRWQGALIFFMSFLVGPDLILMDLRNQALPLYLSRPMNRLQYIFGKLLVPLILMSFIGWIPGLLLFFYSASLNGAEWAADHARDPIAIVVALWLEMLVFVLAAFAVSAYARTKLLARVSLFGLYFVFGMLSLPMSAMFGATIGQMINIPTMVFLIWQHLLGQNTGYPMPLAYLSVFGFMALFFLMLWRKIRAYEIVR